MNAPLNVETTTTDATTLVTTTDPRFAFLCVASGHYRLVRDGHEPLDYAFAAVTRMARHWFPRAEAACPT
ncbi:MAG: hypothetical protein GEU95_27860, partial [Rhizobiales bacterium]|nr:hypothetical protein [Hyphomicrobiales bacterium]